MKVHYYPETDSLYIELLKDTASVESFEVCDGLVVDLDDSGVAVGLEIEDLSHFTMSAGAQVGLEIHRRSGHYGEDESVAAFGVDLETLHAFVDGLTIQETVDGLARQPA